MQKEVQHDGTFVKALGENEDDLSQRRKNIQVEIHVFHKNCVDDGHQVV